MRRKILKKKYKNLCKLVLGGIAFFSSMFINQHNLKALPIEPTTPNKSPNVTIDVPTDKPHIMNITGPGSGNIFINWRDFSIGDGEIVKFSNMTNVLNYVTAMSPSLIYGTIDAKTLDNFYLVNPNGILFGPGSHVFTKNLWVSTRYLTEDQIKNFNGTWWTDEAKINYGGLKSSDIFGSYDVADGDVLFLGEVQADKLTIEGNVIQIRNTANLKNADGTAKLAGDAVNLISDNPVEVGYEVTSPDSSNIANNLENPFPFTTDMTQEQRLEKIAEFYDLYQYDSTTDTSGLDVTNKQNWTEENKTSLQNAAAFFEMYAGANATEEDRIITAMAMDSVMRDHIGNRRVQVYPTDSGLEESYLYKEVLILSVPTETDSGYSSFKSQIESNIATLKQNLSNLTNTNVYKYYVASMVGDENMPNSASKLGYNVKTLDGSAGSIIDYRLIDSVTDLNQANYSKYLSASQVNSSGASFLVPQTGKIGGNYMLNRDLDLSNTTFSPLGYGMDFDDFSTESDQINFNGLNFKINGLNTNSSVSDATGLFSVFSGNIKNLRLTNVSLDKSSDTNSAVGGLIGGIVSSTIETTDENGYPAETALETSIKNVSVTGTVNGTNSAGGLVGSSKYGTSKILSTGYRVATNDDQSWYERDDVKGYGYKDWSTGEITWYPSMRQNYSVNFYKISITPGIPKVTFENIDNFAGVESSKDYAGGIVGFAGNDELTIKNSLNNGAVKSTGYAAGIAGYINPSQSTTSILFDKVANLADITVTERTDHDLYGAGGILNSSSTYPEITNSYNTGKITGPNAGGISGNNVWRIENSFNTGDISATSTAAGLFTAGSTSQVVKNSYNAGNVTSSGGSAYGISEGLQ